MEGVKLSEQTRECSCSLQREGIGCGTIACLCSPIFATDISVLLSWQVYDVSSFVSAHPGGTDQIMLGAGHDITPLFHCYHQPKTIKYSMTKENINFGFIILGFLRNTMLVI